MKTFPDRIRRFATVCQLAGQQARWLKPAKSNFLPPPSDMWLTARRTCALKIKCCFCQFAFSTRVEGKWPALFHHHYGWDQKKTFKWAIHTQHSQSTDILHWKQMREQTCCFESLAATSQPSPPPPHPPIQVTIGAKVVLSSCMTGTNRDGAAAEDQD